MITCQEFIDFIARYLDAELPDAEKRSFEEHVSECPPCLDYLKTYQTTVELASQCDPEGELPADVPEDLVQAVLAARSRG